MSIASAQRMKNEDKAAAPDPEARFKEAITTSSKLFNVGCEVGRTLSDARRDVQRARSVLAEAEAHERHLVEQVEHLKGAADVVDAIRSAKPYDVALKAALGKCRKESWAALLKSGATNEQILAVLAKDWPLHKTYIRGEEHRGYARGPEYGKGGPAFWTAETSYEKPALSGPALATEVRRVLKIPEPQKTKPAAAAAAKPASKPPAKPAAAKKPSAKKKPGGNGGGGSAKPAVTTTATTPSKTVATKAPAKPAVKAKGAGGVAFRPQSYFQFLSTVRGCIGGKEGEKLSKDDARLRQSYAEGLRPSEAAKRLKGKAKPKDTAKSAAATKPTTKSLPQLDAAPADDEDDTLFGKMEGAVESIEPGHTYTPAELGIAHVDVDQLCPTKLRELGEIHETIQLSDGFVWAVVGGRHHNHGGKGPSVVDYALQPVSSVVEWEPARHWSWKEARDEHADVAPEDVPLHGVRVIDPQDREWVLGPDEDRIYCRVPEEQIAAAAMAAVPEAERLPIDGTGFTILLRNFDGRWAAGFEAAGTAIQPPRSDLSRYGTRQQAALAELDRIQNDVALVKDVASAIRRKVGTVSADLRKTSEAWTKAMPAAAPVAEASPPAPGRKRRITNQMTGEEGLIALGLLSPPTATEKTPASAKAEPKSIDVPNIASKHKTTATITITPSARPERFDSAYRVQLPGWALTWQPQPADPGYETEPEAVRAAAHRMENRVKDELAGGGVVKADVPRLKAVSAALLRFIEEHPSCELPKQQQGKADDGAKRPSLVKAAKATSRKSAANGHAGAGDPATLATEQMASEAIGRSTHP